MSINVQDLVNAGIFPNAEAAVKEALRVLWQERPGVRIDFAVHQYITEPISVARAAAIAGVAFDRMKDILAERGIALRLGPETIEEARDEIESLRRMLS